MSEGKKPTVPLKQVHEVISVVMDNFEYIIFAKDKNSPLNSNQTEVMMMSNMKRDEAHALLSETVRQLEEGEAYESSMDSDEAYKKYSDENR